MPNKPYDPDQNYERIIGGTWAPYVLCAANDQDNTGPALNTNSKQYSLMESVYSVDIVFTSDKSKWSRALVVEMCPDNKLSPRR